jgi:hypothetical protein
MKRKGGRPTKLIPEVRKIVLDTIASGVPRSHATKRAGISRGTLWGWLKRGIKSKKGEFFDFLNAVKKAEGEAVTVSLARIRKAGAGGQVIERTTKTVTTRDRNGKPTTTTTVTERFTQGQWQADAWFLERCYSHEFALWRKKDLNDEVKKELEKAIKEGKLHLSPKPPKKEEDLRTIYLPGGGIIPGIDSV